MSDLLSNPLFILPLFNKLILIKIPQLHWQCLVHYNKITSYLSSSVALRVQYVDELITNDISCYAVGFFAP